MTTGPITRVAYQLLDLVYGARWHARRPRGFAEMAAEVCGATEVPSEV